MRKDIDSEIKRLFSSLYKLGAEAVLDDNIVRENNREYIVFDPRSYSESKICPAELNCCCFVNGKFEWHVQRNIYQTELYGGLSYGSRISYITGIDSHSDKYIRATDFSDGSFLIDKETGEVCTEHGLLLEDLKALRGDA